jgi:hypothetical protein
MLADKDQEYHARRALEELDLAYRAEKRVAMARHMQLSSLHMRRARLGCVAERVELATA